MAPTKFASMLHTRTNKITRVLIYAFLEWTLIFLLLLNSLFSYFILKFALYFGLKPPCLFCSRLDHLLDSQKKHKNNNNKSLLSYKDIICEQHATEISTIGYCSLHRKLVESQVMCDDCSSSSTSSSLHQHDQHHDAHGSLFMWMKTVGIIKADEGEHDHNKTCSCCDVVIKVNPTKVSSSLDFMANLITDRELAGCFTDQDASGDHVVFNQRELVGSDQSDFVYQVLDDGDDEEEKVVDDDDEEFETEKQPLLDDIDDCDGDKNKEIVSAQNLSPEMLPQHLEFYIDHDDYRLIPVEMLGGSVKVVSESEENDGKIVGGHEKVLEQNSLDDCKKEGIISEVLREVDLVFEGDDLLAGYHVSDKNLPSIQEDEDDEHEQQEEAAVQSSENSETYAFTADNLERKDGCLPCLEDHQVEEQKMDEHSEVLLIPQVDEQEKREIQNLCILQEEEKNIIAEITPIIKAIDTENEAISDLQSAPTVCNKGTEFLLRENEIETERNEELAEKRLIEIEENPTPCEIVYSTITNNATCEVSTSIITNDNDNKQDEEAGKDTSTYVEINERSLSIKVGLSSNDVEEERVPDTPTSVESFHHLHKKLFLLGRRGSVTEESLDGSIISEHEAGDGVAVVEKLKLELQAEKRALRALYAELEEERNASAIAANQTMAMITRLQEEKATMQMEALQYQRMMEEQSEYDQEALQMMNELMVKREKEKQELEKELEVYRKKLIELEEREKMRILSRRRDGSMRSRNSSASCSHGEDSDGVSIDLNHETAKDQEQDVATATPHSHQENGHQDTPTDAVLGLHDSLASFEDERLSILEQLKLLEHKLFTLAEEEEEHIQNMQPFEQFYEENRKDFDDSYNDNSDANGAGTDFAYQNGKHRLNGSMPKRLLPLFDAAELLDSPDGTIDGEGDGFDMVFSKSRVTKFESEIKKVAIEQEVDQVYERLHALEADREFLKHCIGSLRKGDKGLDLLQEILQHLRDLKNVELQVMKNMEPCGTV